MTRRQQFATAIPRIVRSEKGGAPISIADLYSVIERDYPDLVDDDVEPNTSSVRWKHELRWELETAVVKGDVRRRKDLGRGVYST